jgi:palmitoyltransferase ZDHHC9/14/18
VSITLLLTLNLSMLVTAFSDPGILPKFRDKTRYIKDPLRVVDTMKENPQLLFTSNGKCLYMIPHMGTIKMMRYCRICNLYRPPTRTVHCYTCDNCVIGFDHHCIWLGTCIGGGNYNKFLTFLTILVTWIGFLAGSCAYHISALK